MPIRLATNPGVSRRHDDAFAKTAVAKIADKLDGLATGLRAGYQLNQAHLPRRIEKNA